MGIPPLNKNMMSLAPHQETAAKPNDTLPIIGQPHMMPTTAVPVRHEKPANGTASEVKAAFEIKGGEGSRESAAELSAIMPAIESVLPEIPTPVEMSTSDTNRLICPEGVEARDAGETDVIMSKEKGLAVKVVGRNVFVKFQERKAGDVMKFSSTPSELFVVCGDTVYNIIAIPKTIPSRTVRLVDGIDKVKKNLRAYGALGYEKKLIEIIKSVYRNEVPDSFTVAIANRHIRVYEGLDIVLSRIMTVEGEGFMVKEYRINNIGKEAVELAEKDFLRKEFTTAPAAVSMDRYHLAQGDTARLIIVERSRANGSTK